MAADVAGTGMYDPAFEKDSCGFGLIAQLDDRPSRAIVDAALDALKRMTHRGAVAADGKSGDGCGLLLRRPESFLRKLAAEAGIVLPQSFASGIVFLPHDEADATRARVALEAELGAAGLLLAGWREVPTDPDVCGAEARSTMPRVSQVYVGVREDLDLSALERLLFQARRRAEIALADLPDFYVVSLSAHVFAYKGMVMPEHLPGFFKDLARPELVTSAATFHQRFSTNTMPRWPLAQPFRFLAHNGEINSIQGNRNWMRARGPRFRSPLVDFRELQPLVSMTGSDSQTLDNMLECLLVGGMDLLQAMRILIPPAWRDREDLDADIKAFYEYYQLHMEPWDGPAGIVLLDGRYAACTLDRNGLRPARYLVTRDRHVVIASEAGVFDVAASDVVEKGRLGPGEMVAVDLLRGEFLKSPDIDAINRVRAPFRRWMKSGVRYLSNSLIDPSLAIEPWDAPTLAVHQKLYNLSREERDTVLKSLAESESEATGSMGDDTPVAVMSGKVRSLYDYFRQAFAQVTNPPIDSLREQRVMSLMTQLGRECNVFESAPQYARQIVLNSPILSQRKLKQILAMTDFGGHVEIDLNYPATETLEGALSRCCQQAEDAVRDGTLLVFLTDRHTAPDKIPAHALLAVGAVHQHLTRAGLRAACNIVVETATARDPHHFACLIGFGATAIQPYLAYQSLLALVKSGQIKRRFGEPLELGRSFRRGVRKGMLKILSKMGISCVDSYRGAQLFEIVGLASEVVQRCFTGTPSRIEGAGFAEIEAEQRQLAAQSWNANTLVDAGGLLKFMHGGEYHMYNPDVIARLQAAVRSGDYELYREYADVVNSRPASALRDLMDLKSDRAAIPLDQVEPVETILKRFDSAGMSLGALSPEAHEALAIAMNRLGARSKFGRGRRGSGALRHRAHEQDQAGGLGPIWRHAGIPDQRRGAADQGRPGRQAGRGRPIARAQGRRDHRAPALRASGHRTDFAAAAPRHLLDRRSGAADLRSQGNQSAGAGLGQAGIARGCRHHRRWRGQGLCRSDHHLRARRWHRCQSAVVDQVRRHAVGARLVGGASDAQAQRLAPQSAAADRWWPEDRPGRAQGGSAGRREFRLWHRADGGAGLQVPAHLSSEQLRHRDCHSIAGAAQGALRRLAGDGRTLFPFRGDGSARVAGGPWPAVARRVDRPHRVPQPAPGAHNQAAAPRPQASAQPRWDGGRRSQLLHRRAQSAA